MYQLPFLEEEEVAAEVRIEVGVEEVPPALCSVAEGVAHSEAADTSPEERLLVVAPRTEAAEAVGAGMEDLPLRLGVQASEAVEGVAVHHTINFVFVHFVCPNSTCSCKVVTHHRPVDRKFVLNTQK